MNKIQIHVELKPKLRKLTFKQKLTNLFSSTQIQVPNLYMVFLVDAPNKRYIPLVTGESEATSIAIRLNKVIPSRPMTHDLIHHIMNTHHIQITEVLIDKIEEGVFSAKLVTKGINETKIIDARPSDAITIALCCNKPIYVNEDLFKVKGLKIEH